MQRPIDFTFYFLDNDIVRDQIQIFVNNSEFT